MGLCVWFGGFNRSAGRAVVVISHVGMSFRTLPELRDSNPFVLLSQRKEPISYC